MLVDSRRMSPTSVSPITVSKTTARWCVTGQREYVCSLPSLCPSHRIQEKRWPWDGLDILHFHTSQKTAGRFSGTHKEPRIQGENPKTQGAGRLKGNYRYDHMCRPNTKGQAGNTCLSRCLCEQMTARAWLTLLPFWTPWLDI